MVKKVSQEDYVTSIHRYAKANDKYMKHYNKKNLHILNIGMQINCMVGQ